LAKKSATRATTASSATAARRPARRASTFSATIASAVAGGTPALSRVARRSASDTKGTPFVSCTCADSVTLAGTASLVWRPVKNVDVSAPMSTAPASAVPSDAPRLVIVFCTPPTSPLCSSGTDDTVTLPSCEASVPTARPASSSGPVTISAPAPASSAPTRITRPTNNRPKPICTTRRGDARGNRRGMPTAASSSVTDSGSSRTPVWMADSPNETDRNSGMMKNRPACRKYWNPNPVSPLRRPRLRNIAGSSSTLAPRARRRFSHAMNPRSTRPPPSSSQITGDRPSQLGAFGFGCTRPQVPERRIANTTRPSPAAERPVPTRSSFTPGSAGVSAMRRMSARMTATTSTSPTNT
jgi:hypothetical protein